MVCPVYKPGTHVEDLEKYIIYNVSKEEYYLCRITNSNPRIVAVCDKPYKLMFFTVTFRPFTPQPGGLEFHPGQDYYFISTSSKDDLHRRIGGRCSTDNLKVVFKVCCRSNEQYSNSTGLISHPQHIPGPSRRTTPIPTTSAPLLSSSTSIMAPTSAVPSPQPVPPRELPEIPTHSKPANKKSEFDKRPNEVCLVIVASPMVVSTVINTSHIGTYVLKTVSALAGRSEQLYCNTHLNFHDLPSLYP
ncbi:hypothetical protein B566_EDAN001147 [Ephemera danica]|nr:hypothetical protein B566_EDAN001147 [Ephemera danica]